jgi:[glutamine synthetase] adenylyltransferase / [glutamine synthetase]-adenylyl-L-tyrosine phosphorylase
MPDNWQIAVDNLPAPLQREAQLAWEHISARCDDAQREQYSALLNRPGFARHAATLFACSPFAAQLCQRFPAWLLELHRAGDLEHSLPAAAWHSRLSAALDSPNSLDALDSGLRRFRNREFLRLIWRDFNRLAPMLETTADISAVAEHCIQAALDFHYVQLSAEWGIPQGPDGASQPLVVLGMGKLGAHELNLSSDIDLIFAYPHSGETAGGLVSVSNQEFFVRLGQRVIKSLDQATADGFVFRVDMRLRPYGDSGALVLNFDALEEYYQNHGRDWERYAMIKARPVAENIIDGGATAGAALMAMLRPFTYRRYLDYSAFAALREMKALIQREVQRRRLQDNIKLGPGGIREVEFIAQCFQLIRGGREISLQERQLGLVLQTLGALGYLPPTAVDELQRAYVFLRNTEHAIQGYNDKQTQELPTSELPRAALTLVMGCADWTSFKELLDEHRKRVSEQFQNIITAPPQQADEKTADPHHALQNVWQEAYLIAADIAAQLETAGFDNASEVARRLLELRSSKTVLVMQPLGRERLDNFMPRLLMAAADSANPGTTLLRILPLVEAVVRRTAYLVLLNENPAALRELVVLCAASPWISAQLAQHPVLLDELLNAGTLYVAPEKEVLQSDLQQQVLRLSWDDLEAHMEALRYFKLAHVLRVAASEVNGTLPLMKVSDYLTWIAEAILEHVLELAWRHLIAKHGAPQRANGLRDNGLPEKDFIIVGYGKLGGIELGHGSDLDLVFIHAADATLATNGDPNLQQVPIDNGTFFTRLGQRIIHILTAQTALGSLYEVDMRLRPSGNSGLLVSSLKSFTEYQQKDAWTWEHQALVRARAVAGDKALTDAFANVRQEILCAARDPIKLRKEVVDMRQKMRAQLRPKDTETEAHPYLDLKQGSGAIVDIEFIVQYAVLAWSHRHPALAYWTDNIRILETLEQEGLLTVDAAQGLIAAYKSYRMAAHRLNLAQQPARRPLVEFESERSIVLAQWRDLFN